MIITYKNKKIKSICCNAEIATRTYGEMMATKIQMRIEELAAAPSVEIMVNYRIGRCHQLKGNRKGQYAVDLIQPYRLVFITKEEEIQVAQIQEITDYH